MNQRTRGWILAGWLAFAAVVMAEDVRMRCMVGQVFFGYDQELETSVMEYAGADQPSMLIESDRRVRTPVGNVADQAWFSFPVSAESVDLLDMQAMMETLQKEQSALALQDGSAGMLMQDVVRELNMLMELRFN